MRKPIRQRNAEQRERQQAYRARQKAERRPSRDDIARMFLHYAITESVRSPKGRERLNQVEAEIVKRLVEQGFEERASYVVFDDLIERYTREKWEFRRKVHLSAGEPRDPSETGHDLGDNDDDGTAGGV